MTDGLAGLAPVSLSSAPSAASRALATASPVSTAIVPDHRVIPVPSTSHIDSVYRVLARDTLFDIVRRAGALTEADVQQMMIAVFLANPEAFDRNINILRRGALLNMPSARDVAAVDPAAARSAVARQMQHWKLYSVGADFHPAGSGLIALPPSARQPDESAAMQLLNDRVQSLESALEAERQQVASMKATIQDLRQPAPLTPVQAPTAAIKTSPAPLAARVGTKARATLLGSLALFLGLPLVSLLVLGARRWRLAAARRPARRPGVAKAAGSSSQPEDNWLGHTQQSEAAASTVEIRVRDDIGAAQHAGHDGATASMEADTQQMEQLEADCAAAEASSAAAQSADGVTVETAMPNTPAAQPDLKRLQGTVLDYNLVDLDSNAPHVHMPSDLNDRTNFVERRTNIVDALRAAIARDPFRRDLCMKLLETYHSSAAANRRAFQEFVHMQATGPSSLSAADWQKILMMSQEIALDVNLPADKEDSDLASCA